MEKEKIFTDIREIENEKGIENYTIVSEIGAYTIINRHTSYLPWVAAWLYHKESKCWANGNYFSTLEDAVLYALNRTNECKLINTVIDICDRRGDRQDIGDMLMEMMADENMMEG